MDVVRSPAGTTNDVNIARTAVCPCREERKIKIQGEIKTIQSEIRTKLGLLVNVVKPPAGTTNDGNTARTAM